MTRKIHEDQSFQKLKNPFLLIQEAVSEEDYRQKELARALFGDIQPVQVVN